MQIYKITNLINNKIYIGKDVRDRDHYFGSGMYIKNAIKKYGKKNFKKEILQDNVKNKQDLSKAEKFWIKKLKSQAPNGYNLTKGGDGFSPVGEALEQMSKRMKKLWKNSEYRKKQIKSGNSCFHPKGCKCMRCKNVRKESHTKNCKCFSCQERRGNHHISHKKNCSCWACKKKRGEKGRSDKTQFKKGQIPWNKGLTKETDKRVLTYTINRLKTLKEKK